MEFFKQSDSTKNLDDALVKFDSKMPAIKRSSDVSMKGTSKAGKEFEVSYEYAPLEAVQEKAKPLLAEFGLNVKQFLSCVKILDAGQEVLKEGIVTRVGHSSGEWAMAFWPMDMNGIGKEQDRGSKITYNKRYAYVAALDIALEDEDNDAQGVGAGKSKGLEVDEKDLANFVMPFGNKNVKGKKLSECNPKDLADCYNYFVEKAKADNKPLDGNLKIALDASRKYCEGLTKKDDKK